MFDNSAVKLPNIIRDDTKRRSTLMDTVKLTNIDVASEEKFIYEQKVLKNLKKDIFNFYTNNLNADKENRQFLGLIDKNYGIVDKNNTHQVNNSPVVLPNIETQAYKSRQLRHSHSEYKITKVNPFNKDHNKDTKEPIYDSNKEHTKEYNKDHYKDHNKEHKDHNKEYDLIHNKNSHSSLKISQKKKYIECFEDIKLSKVSSEDQDILDKYIKEENKNIKYRSVLKMPTQMKSLFKKYITRKEKVGK